MGATLRYYLYISSAKVDGLLPQIDPAARRKQSTEFRFDFKLFGAKRSRERVIGEDRVERLEAVERYLRDEVGVGSIDDPSTYFAGELSMQWGPYGETDDSQLVYFGGSTEHTIVALGGSSGNVLGSTSGGSQAFSHSATPALIAALSRDNEELKAPPGTDNEELSLMAVHIANKQMRGPAQRLEFLAKRLLHGPSPYPERDEHDGMMVLLGSPLYVAMTD